MYKQALYTIHKDHLSDKKIKHTNKHKNFKYGYNEDLDCVIISKDGTLGEIYNIQGLKVGLPKLQIQYMEKILIQLISTLE